MNDPKSPDGPVALIIKWTDFASKNLNARIAELRRREHRGKSDPVTEGIQFLRGVSSRGSVALPHLYMLIGSSTRPKAGGAALPWSGTLSASLNFSALQTLSLICRSVFDESRKESLTGRRFARAGDETLEGIAKHWSTSSGEPVEDAVKALRLLRDLFDLCAQPRNALLKGTSLLERRVGLLKCLADRQSAHITPWAVSRRPDRYRARRGSAHGRRRHHRGLRLSALGTELLQCTG